MRGFDVRTGRRRWVFQSIPQAGEFGVETWLHGSWKTAGNVNVWAAMSADEELGYVYLPFAAGTDDWYGVRRPGNNLFAESLVCLEAATGKRVWHFQIAHHGLWNYDLAAAPNLLDLVIAGRKVRAVAQVTKQGFCFVFDRVSGQPIWPIEERPVPVSRVPGERSSPTQPFPTRPAPFDRQGIGPDDLIDFTPDLRRKAVEIMAEFRYGPLYTPPDETIGVQLPGWAGGASWSGAAVDPETATLYVTSVTDPSLVSIVRETVHGTARLASHVTPPPTVEGLPLVKPPYSRVTAINLNTGNHAWKAPVGSGPRDHPLLKHLHLPPLGWTTRAFALVTRTLLFVGQEGPGTGKQIPGTRVFGVANYHSQQPKLYVFDKTTGRALAEVATPGFATGALMTYMAGGKQYIVMPSGGASLPAELVALSLP